MIGCGGRMNRRQFFVTASAASLARIAPAQSRPPNIVWIMADDLGYGDVGCYGQKYIRTPNIDRLSTQGMQFSDAYAGCTVCAPSRSVLMTGLHAGHTSVRSNPGGVPILASDYTVAQMLKSAGYATGGFGKWGLGDVGTEGVPSKHGFDEFFGYYHQVHAHYYYPQYLIDNEKKVPLAGNDNGKRTTYSHDVIANRALDFIRKNASRPFYAYMPFTVPHLELLVPDDSMNEYLGKLPEGKPWITPQKHYADQPHVRATYAGMVSRLDRDVGRVMSLLKELKLEDNTFFVFCSDNGVSANMQADGFFKGEGPFRGAKGSMYEGGLRVPMIARWPGHIKAGSRSDFPWYFADWFATAAALSGGKLPSGLDGLSVLPTLTGKGSQQPHDFLYWELPRYIAKTGDFVKELPPQAARMGDWKAVRPKPEGPVELYNLKTDIGETTNLAADNPKILERLEKYLETAHVQPRQQKEPETGDFHLANGVGG
jgi:arylsulfatase A-like enzyme